MQMCRRLEHIQRPGSGFQVFILVAEGGFPRCEPRVVFKGTELRLVLGGANSHLRDDDADGAALSRAP